MTRTLMIHRPPQCPSCHTHSHDERIDLEESYNPPIPSYNEESARRAMQESENIGVSARNSVSDEEDWEERVNKFGWTVQQFKLFDRVARLLDMDRLARLTNTEKQHEPVHRRTVIDKSVSRLRQALASVSWETRLTQWLHVLLMENLPPSYLAIYIDMLQTLHAKLPLLVDKMIFGSTLNIGQELLGPVLKKPWEPIVTPKNRKLPGQPFIVVVPSVPTLLPSPRHQKWFTLFSTMSPVVVIQPPQEKSTVEKPNIDKQSLQQLAEHMLAMTRAKIQQVRSSAPNRPIILVGFDAGSALAIQVGLVESISCVICLGFSYNTYNGVRGAPDDHIVDITCPVLFVIGQNSARASHEEIEMLRDRMSTQTSLVVVGAADECLRVSKTKRKIEGVTQSMVDNMVADEIAEFATNCLVSPPRPKQSALAGSFQSDSPMEQSMPSAQRNDCDLAAQRKRKHAPDPKAETKQQKKPYNRRLPKTTQSAEVAQSLTQSTQDAPDIEAQSNTPTTPEKQIKSEKIILPLAKADEVVKYEVRESGNTQIISGRGSTPMLLPALKRDTAQTTLSAGALHQQGNVNVKLIESNQLIHLKPSTGTTQKFYSITSTSKPVMSVIANSSPGVNDGAVTSEEISSPPKYTIVRNTGSTPTVFSNVNESNVAAGKVTKALSETNIFDLPIVFADNDGVIQEGSPEKPKQAQDTRPAVTAPASVGIAENNASSAQASGTRFVTLQQPAGSMPLSIGKPKQVINLVLNKGTLKTVDPGGMIVPVGTKINLPIAVASSASPATSVGTVMSSGTTGPKFTKVVLTKPMNSGATNTSVVKNLSELLSGGKIEIVNSAGMRQTGVTGTPLSVPQGKFQSIIINPFGANKAPGSATVQNTSTSGSSTTAGNLTLRFMILRTVCLHLRVPVAQCLFTLLSNRLIHQYKIGCRFNYTGRCNLWHGKENLTKMLTVRPSMKILAQMQPLALQKTPINRPFWGWVNMMFNRVDRARLKKVGPDRLCAEWLLKNGAKAKFVKDARVHVHFNALPDESLPVLMEELDGTDSGIMHIGFDHLEGLSRLRKVVLHNCVYIDNQALWKLRYVANTLEELQISKCGNVTDAGLVQLKQLPQLQQVKTFDLPDVKNIQEVEKTLKQALPNCKFDMKP
ncbi:KAT8 regulatory NSL complex subunit 3 [Anopheles gambiae]|uniref:KAT8 regulatory NSL complex subunit 3 n=1 Tax=Anopheles gambiae TaxID=7165 RepID=UPI002AC8ACD7|nr:KAT8 regulatory NSL complex subunit 3 [Anopheles gambiae]